MSYRFSIVILTYNRPNELRRTTSELLPLLAAGDVELIIVDNHSEQDLQAEFSKQPHTRYLRQPANVGVASRNIGIRAASAPSIITLDDDVSNVTADDLVKLDELFASDATIGAINFRVLDRETKEQINWSHHLDMAEWGKRGFDTYEISEGAVALRASAFHETTGYPDYFFISHEGPDLAVQLMNAGYRVLYEPSIAVVHSHAPEGRPSWRRYYYDTRNSLLHAIRALPVSLAIGYLFINLSAMFVYSIRDGYMRYWLRGVASALKHTPQALRDRFGMSPEVARQYRLMQSREPGLMMKAKRRLKGSEVGI